MAYLGLSIRGGERRDEELRFARRLGYTAVEISMDGTGLVFGGQLRKIRPVHPVCHTAPRTLHIQDDMRTRIDRCNIDGAAGL